MKRRNTRIPAAALLGLVVLCQGCGGDNEDFIRAQQAANAGKGDAGPTGPPPKDQREYFKQQQQAQQQNYSKASGYPSPK